MDPLRVTKWTLESASGTRARFGLGLSTIVRRLLPNTALCGLFLVLGTPLSWGSQSHRPAQPTWPSSSPADSHEGIPTTHEEGPEGSEDDDGDDDDSASGDDDDSASFETSPLKPPFALPPAFPPLRLDDVPAEASAPAPDRAELSIIYEGATGGISGANSDLWADRFVSASLKHAPGDWTRVQSGFSAFQREGRWLLQRGGGIRQFHQAALGGLRADVTGAEEVEVLLGDDFAVIAWPKRAAEAIVPILEESLSSAPLRPPPKRVAMRGLPQESSDDDSILLVSRRGDDGPLEEKIDPLNWEVRLQTVYRGRTEDGQEAWVHVVARVTGEGARRYALTSAWRRSPSLYLSAGESVEGRSFLSGEELSLQRSHTWAAWKQLELTALAPGLSELIAGLDTLEAEAEGAGTRLCSVNLADPKGAPLFEQSCLETLAGRRIALLGWTDPGVAARLPPSLSKQLQVRGREALYEVLAQLASEPTDKPELVVLFGQGARSLAGHLPGVDIVLGDFTAELRLPRWEEVGEGALRSRAAEHPKARSPALVARLGPGLLGRIDLAFDDETDTLRRLRHLRARIGEDIPAANDWLRRVQGTRQEVYSSLEEILVPDLGELRAPTRAPKWLRRALPAKNRPATVLDSDGFARLAANLLLTRTGAQAALLRPLPHPIDVQGATQELVVDASLSVPDEVVLVDLTGAQLKALVSRIRIVQPKPGRGDPESTMRSDDRWAWAAGITADGSKITVRGRPVADDERIRLATTNFLSDDPTLAPTLKKAQVRGHFRDAGWRYLLVDKAIGQPLLLHDLVKGGLVILRDEDPSFGTAYQRELVPLMTDQSTRVSPRLTLELDGISVQLTGSVPVGDREGYENSRESRVQQQQSFTTAIRGRVALVYDDRIGSATAYALAAFGQTQIADTDEPIEHEDDLQAGAEGRIKVVNLPVPKTPIRLSTFIQTAFDTEFVAGTDADGVPLPLQRLWRTTSGFTLGRYRLFKEGKGGFFVEYDLEAEVGPVSPGFTVGVQTEKRWGPVRWATLLDLKGYLPTPVDTEEDLLFTLQMRSDLGVTVLRRLFPGLAIGGFVDALFFQGKMPSNDQAGIHLLVGVSLSYDADVRAPLPLR